MQPDLKLGQVVISKAGRDKGNVLVVYKLEDGFVYVVNGKNRSIKNPKKKNVKHLQRTNIVSEFLARRFKYGKKVTDKEIKSELKELVPHLFDENGEM